MRKKSKSNVTHNNKQKKISNIKIIVIFLLIIVLISLIEFMLIKIYFDKFNNKRNVSNIYNLQVKTNDNFIFLGDSLTEGYPLDEFYSNIPVVNSGIGGNTTDDILADLQNRVYQYNPTKVFILIGINDMRYGKDNEYIIKNILKIVEEIKKNRPDAKIYVESLYPINDSDDEKIFREGLENRSNKKINEINEKLNNKFEDTDVTYIDVNSILKENGMLKLSYTKDGIHLTPLGYIKVTSILLPYMQN